MADEIISRVIKQMGCTTPLSQFSISKNQIIVRHISNENKQKLGDAIEADDCISMALIMQEIQAYPNSEISDPKMGWMLSHLCCRWDSNACLSFLLRHYFTENPKGYINYVNAQTAQGYACLHLCSLWNSYKCFKVLHNFGGLSLGIRQNKLKNPYEIAVQYKSSRIVAILKQYKQLNINFICTKVEKLIDGPLLSENYDTERLQTEGEPIQIDKSFLKVQLELMSTTQTQKKILDQKTQVETSLEKLLQSKLQKSLDYDIKRSLIFLIREVQEHQKAQFQKKQKDKLKFQLEQQEKQIQNQIQSKQEILKQINQIIKKIENERLQKITNEAEQKIEEATRQVRLELVKKLKQKQEILKKYKNCRTSIKSRETKTFKLQQNQDDLKQKLKKCPDDIIKQYEKAKAEGYFVDNQFPAQNSSIGDASKSKYLLYTSNTVWLRPVQIFKSQFKLFDGIDPSDIKQGSLGVCYMLATLSALAKNPQNIKKIFIFDDISLGFYVLKLFVNGKPTFFVIDDLIPCCRTTKAPLFTQPIGKQIWVLLLEKAWAKLVGNYLSAESMTPDHMMEDLSGAPGYGWWLTKQNSKTPTQKIKQIVQHSSLGHIVVVTSVGDRKIEGIVNNHAYTMLETVQYNNRFIFKLRNPWGRFEWSGQFGDNSSLCSQQFKKKVAYDNKDDGIFFISQNELLKAFCFYSISHIKSDFYYSFAPFQSKDKQDIFFTFKLKAGGDVNIRITQPFDRMVNDKNYKYSPMIFEVGKIIENNEIKFISQGHQKTYFGAKSVHAFQQIFKHLEEGEYFLRIRMLWQDDKKYNQAVLSCYAIQSVDLQKIQYERGIQMLKRLYVSFAAHSKKNRAGQGIYRISTMKGQFVFVAEIEEQGNFKVAFKFIKQKMIKTETDLGKMSAIQLETMVSKGNEGVVTAMRLEPSHGGTTGPVSITFTKV